MPAASTVPRYDAASLLRLRDLGPARSSRGCLRRQCGDGSSRRLPQPRDRGPSATTGSTRRCQPHRRCIISMVQLDRTPRVRRHQVRTEPGGPFQITVHTAPRRAVRDRLSRNSTPPASDTAAAGRSRRAARRPSESVSFDPELAQPRPPRLEPVDPYELRPQLRHRNRKRERPVVVDDVRERGTPSRYAGRPTRESLKRPPRTRRTVTPALA